VEYYPLDESANVHSVLPPQSRSVPQPQRFRDGRDTAGFYGSTEYHGDAQQKPRSSISELPNVEDDENTHFHLLPDDNKNDKDKDPTPATVESIA